MQRRRHVANGAGEAHPQAGLARRGKAARTRRRPWATSVWAIAPMGCAPLPFSLYLEVARTGETWPETILNVVHAARVALMTAIEGTARDGGYGFERHDAAPSSHTWTAEIERGGGSQWL